MKLDQRPGVCDYILCNAFLRNIYNNTDSRVIGTVGNIIDNDEAFKYTKKTDVIFPNDDCNQLWIPENATNKYSSSLMMCAMFVLLTSRNFNPPKQLLSFTLDEDHPHSLQSNLFYYQCKVQSVRQAIHRDFKADIRKIVNDPFTAVQISVQSLNSLHCNVNIPKKKKKKSKKLNKKEKVKNLMKKKRKIIKNKKKTNKAKNNNFKCNAQKSLNIQAKKKNELSNRIVIDLTDDD